MQLAIDVAKEMMVDKTFWTIIIGCIICGIYMKWSENNGG